MKECNGDDCENVNDADKATWVWLATYLVSLMTTRFVINNYTAAHQSINQSINQSMTATSEHEWQLAAVGNWLHNAHGSDTRTQIPTVCLIPKHRIYQRDPTGIAIFLLLLDLNFYTDDVQKKTEKFFSQKVGRCKGPHIQGCSLGLETVSRRTCERMQSRLGLGGWYGIVGFNVPIDTL